MIIYKKEIVCVDLSKIDRLIGFSRVSAYIDKDYYTTQNKYYVELYTELWFCKKKFEEILTKWFDITNFDQSFELIVYNHEDLNSVKIQDNPEFDRCNLQFGDEIIHFDDCIYDLYRELSPGDEPLWVEIVEKGK